MNAFSFIFGGLVALALGLGILPDHKYNWLSGIALIFVVVTTVTAFKREKN